eukprot:c22873_g2_i1 orf=167-1291(-)
MEIQPNECKGWCLYAACISKLFSRDTKMIRCKESSNRVTELPCLLLLIPFLIIPHGSFATSIGRALIQDNWTILVDPSGSGDHTTIQAAVDAIPDGNNQPVTIQVIAGTYVEKVVVPANKPFVTLQGAGRDVTLIQWNLKASDVGVDGQEITAYNTASVTVLASNFVAKDISFKNTQPPPTPGVDGEQAAAFRISGDMAAFYRCGFYGGQDTLCDDEGKHYFEDCFIQGSIDFIFGNGKSVYKGCELNSIAQSYGSIAAQDRQTYSDDTGFSFLNCKVTGTGPLYLGRAMGPYSRIVYAYSYFEGIIDPRGWDDWDHDTSKDQTVYYGQYKCYGPGASESGRVSWSHELSDSEAQTFVDISFVDGDQWLQASGA